MEIKQHKDSVIARLMGLDEVQPQQTIHKRQRVLSENYLRRSASIGVREGSLFHIVKHVSGGQVSKKDEHDAFGNLGKKVNSITNKIQIGTGMKENARATFLTPTTRGGYSYEGIFDKKREQRARRNVLRPLQKLEKDCSTGHFKDLDCDSTNKLKSCLERIDQANLSSTNRVMSTPNTKMEKRDFGSVTSDLLPILQDRDCDESSEPEQGELLNELTYKDPAINNMDSSTHGDTDCRDKPRMNDACRYEEHDSGISKSTISDLDNQSSVDIINANAEGHNKEISSSVYKHLEDWHSSAHIMETLTGQACSDPFPRDLEALAGQVLSSNECSKEAAVSSDCLRIGLQTFCINSKGTSQSSPNSILEPFEEENSSIFEYLESVNADLYSHQLQLHLPKPESDGTYSEGSEIGTISDLETEKGSNDVSEDSGKLLRFFGGNESRDFSYLVDVLDKAQLQGLNIELDFEKWHSPECPLSPLVFEALEKKYTNQTSWPKLQRQLLFNVINSGLREIFNPYLHVNPLTPFRRRFSAKLTRDEIEEELWMLLVSQENEESKGLFEKALGKEIEWLDLDEDIDIICQELETHLFDDLVSELALIEIFDRG